MRAMPESRRKLPLGFNLLSALAAPSGDLRGRHSQEKLGVGHIGDEVTAPVSRLRLTSAAAW